MCKSEECYPPTGVRCPIDEHQLETMSVTDEKGRYKGARSSCPHCGASYTAYDRNPISLRKQAHEYLLQIEAEMEEHRKEHKRLEAIIKAAEKSGLINPKN